MLWFPNCAARSVMTANISKSFRKRYLTAITAVAILRALSLKVKLFSTWAQEAEKFVISLAKSLALKAE